LIAPGSLMSLLSVGAVVAAASAVVAVQVDIPLLIRFIYRKLLTQ